MGISDFFNGPKFKLEIGRLQQEIKELEQQKDALTNEKTKLEIILRKWFA